MKASILFVLFLAVGLVSAQAQQFNFLRGPHVSDTVLTNTSSGTIDVKFAPKDSLDIQVAWKVLSNTLDPNWGVTMCDYPACFPFVPDSGMMVTVTAAEMQTGLSPFFNLKVDVNEIVTEGEVVIYAWDVNNPNVGDTVSFTFATKEAPAGVSNLTADPSFQLFPNPANDMVSMRGASIDQVQVFDLAGTLVLSQGFNNQQFAQMDVSSLPSGAYMVVATGATSVTRTNFVKN